jgi:hypothetical protein
LHPDLIRTTHYDNKKEKADSMLSIFGPKCGKVKRELVPAWERWHPANLVGAAIPDCRQDACAPRLIT